MSERLFGVARLLVALFLVGIPHLESAAQDRYAQIAMRHGHASAYHEAVVLPSGPITGEQAAQVAVLFRIPHSMLVFVQDGNGFVSHAEVTVEIYRQGEKIDETVWRGERRVATFEQTRSNEEDVAGRADVRLAPGKYAYRLELDGSTPGARSGTPSYFDVPSFEHGGIGTPFFVSGSSEDSTSLRLQPVNLGGDVPFGRAVLAAVPVAFTGSQGSLSYSVHRIGDERAFQERQAKRQKAGEPEDIELGPDDTQVRQGSVGLDSAAAISDLESDCFCWQIGETGPARLAFVDLDTESLENGAYVLDLKLTTDEETLQHRTVFQTYWRNMPLSLYDVDVAIRNLSFIESRDRIRAMLRGSREEKVAALRAYWQDRDPSPETLANELMTEYYRRVDHAASEFRTGKAPFPDGLRTDAARVYIVHGPPDDISNSFPSSGGVQQVWTYPNGRQFIFWASSSLEPLVLEERLKVRGGENGS